VVLAVGGLEEGEGEEGGGCHEEERDEGRVEEGGVVLDHHGCDEKLSAQFFLLFFFFGVWYLCQIVGTCCKTQRPNYYCSKFIILFQKLIINNQFIIIFLFLWYIY